MQTTAAITGLRACPACGAMNATRFCGDCGRSVEAAPPRTVEVLKEGASELFGVDKSALRTLRDLLLHPLKVADAVRSGNEAGYVRPFRLFFLLVSVYILLLTTVQPHAFSMADQVRPQDMAKMVEAAARNGITADAMNAAYQQRTNMLLPLISALLLFPMAMLLRRMDRSHRLADHVLTMASITNSAFVTCIVLMPVAFLGKWAFVAAAQLASIGYMGTAVVHFYPAATRFRTGLRVIGFLVANYAVAMLVTMVMMLGVIVSVMRF
ncbi:MAG TPA: DUF3667 domain-containing protein [Longimicrobium sp.]|nr:DUF3667 domain-containing protein [Longimicrobium sp.]